MSDLSIPDALCEDLRALFLADQPITPELPEAACRVLKETEELSSPRLVFVPGQPQRISGMDHTSRCAFELHYISALDRETPDAHRIVSGKIDEWLRTIRISKRRALLGANVWMHDLYNLHPVFSVSEEREQMARIRGEAIVTLAVTAPAV